MKQFYREYNRASKAASLQRAMLHVRNYYPHPGYWAAFILTGDYF
jgi:CHAT domain-containing protein